MKLERAARTALALSLMLAPLSLCAQSSQAPATPPKSSTAQGTSPAPTAQKPGTSSSNSTRLPASSVTQPKATTKEYCNEEAGFCFSYPQKWELLGEVFEGDGVVVAPLQEGKERADWNQITVAALPQPEPTKGSANDDFNSVVTLLLTGIQGGAEELRTLERRADVVDEMDAQFLKLEYREKATGKAWMEDIVFVDGPENIVYSIALKAPPNEIKALEPAFRAILKNFRQKP